MYIQNNVRSCFQFEDEHKSGSLIYCKFHLCNCIAEREDILLDLGMGGVASDSGCLSSLHGGLAFSCILVVPEMLAKSLISFG